jgi:hypothetical protein
MSSRVALQVSGTANKIYQLDVLFIEGVISEVLGEAYQGSISLG